MLNGGRLKGKRPNGWQRNKGDENAKLFQRAIRIRRTSSETKYLII